MLLAAVTSVDVTGVPLVSVTRQLFAKVETPGSLPGDTSKTYVVPP